MVIFPAALSMQPSRSYIIFDKTRQRSKIYWLVSRRLIGSSGIRAAKRGTRPRPQYKVEIRRVRVVLCDGDERSIQCGFCRMNKSITGSCLSQQVSHARRLKAFRDCDTQALKRSLLVGGAALFRDLAGTSSRWSKTPERSNRNLSKQTL